MELPTATWSTDTQLNLDILTINIDNTETSYAFTREALAKIGENILTSYIKDTQ